MADNSNPTGAGLEDRVRKDLFNAICSGNKTLVGSLLDKHRPQLDVANLKEPQQLHTGLFMACVVEEPNVALQITEMLIAAGANVNHLDVYKQTALFAICRDGKEALFDAHLRGGADIHVLDGLRQSAMFYAAREGRVALCKKLLDAGVPVDHLDVNEETALFYACTKGQLETCRLLIEAGANVNQVDNKRQMPLYFAKKHKHQAVIELLIEKGAINTKTGKMPQRSEARRVDKSKASSVASNLTKRTNQVKGRMKSLLRLVVTDEKGNSRHITRKEFEELMLRYPRVCGMLQDPSTIPQDQLGAEHEDWEQTASSIVTNIWGQKGASIFHKPVDPVELGIPDYFTIVKKPMDLSTVKKKLQLNVYPDVQAWIADMKQIFYNCRIYNGTGGDYGKTGVDCLREFEKLINLYKIEEKFNNSSAHSLVEQPVLTEEEKTAPEAAPPAEPQTQAAENGAPAPQEPAPVTPTPAEEEDDNKMIPEQPNTTTTTEAPVPQPEAPAVAPEPTPETDSQKMVPEEAPVAPTVEGEPTTTIAAQAVVEPTPVAAPQGEAATTTVPVGTAPN